MGRLSHSTKKNALKIVFIYAGVSIVWILLSDRLLHSLPLDPEMLSTVSIFKGWVFVLVTALMLYAITRKYMIDSTRAFRRQMDLEKRWEFALDVAGDGVWDWQFDKGRYDFAGKWTKFLGQRSGLNKKPETWFDVIHPDDQASLQKAVNDHVRGLTQRFEKEHRVIGPGNNTKWLLARGLGTERDPAGRARRFSGVVIDITKQKEVEHELRIAATALDSNEAKMITDSDKKIVMVNRAFTSITGYARHEVIGKDPSILKSGIQSADFYEEMWRSIDEKGSWQGEIWNRRKNGQEYPEWLRINVVKDNSGKVTNYIASFNDVTDLKQARSQIDHLSHYDTLTHLPNKQSMMFMLEQFIMTSGRTSNYAALMFVDLKNFKALNSAMGHNIGDVILKELSARLSDTSQHITVSRYGGDVFAILASHIGNDMDDAAYNAHQLAELMVAKISEPVMFDNFQYRADIRIGINAFHPGDNTSSEVLRQAEMAINEAKTLDTTGIVFFNNEIQSRIQRRFNLETKLRQAIPTQLLLNLQLQVDNDGHASGAEVLIRWQDPSDGMISPAEFIPIAEKTGLINQIGDWVLSSACQQIAIWSTHTALSQLTLSVNVSPKQFMQADFIEKVTRTISETNISASKLKLELTESIFVEDYKVIIEKMEKLKSLGIKISLDDFGTGFSSLAYLRRLPIDELKIDQSFVRDLPDSSENQAIVESIIRLGQSLGMSVIAEGVETEEQRDKLIDMGCQSFQGYLFSRPVDVATIETMFADLQ